MASVVHDQVDKVDASQGANPVERKREYFHEYDTLAVKNKDPNFKYRWIRSKESRVALQESRGWRVVTEGQEQSVLTSLAGMRRKGADVDGTITNGDLILAKMPRDLHEEKIAKPNRDRIAFQTGSVRSNLRQAAGDLMTEGGEDLGTKMTMKQYDEMVAAEAAKKG
jgi:hypothetical protein